MNAAGYKVYTSPDNITYTPDNTMTSTYNISLDTGDFVYCKITSIIDGNESESSYSVLKAYAALETPDFNVSGDTDDFTICHVTWNSVEKATKYMIYRADIYAPVFKCIATRSTLSYDDTNLTPGNHYYYRVVACMNNDTYSDESAESKTYICKVDTISGIVVNDGFKDQMILVWNVNPNVDGYYVYASTNKNNGYVKSPKINRQYGTYVKSGLALGTRLYFKVSSYVLVGSLEVESDLSAPVEGITMPDIPNVSGITVIEPYTASTATLNWKKPSGNADGLRIICLDSKPTGETNLYPFKEIISFENLNYKYQGLTENTDYYFVLANFINYLEDSSKGQTASDYNSVEGCVKYFRVRTLPPVQTGFYVTKSGNDLTCHWSIPADKDTNPLLNDYDYVIEYSTDYSYSNNSVVTNGNATAKPFEDMLAGTTYHFRMADRAVYIPATAFPSSYQDSEYAYYDITTDLKAPESVTASVESCDYITLTWSKVKAGGQTVSYNVYRWDNVSNDYGQILFTPIEGASSISIHDKNAPVFDRDYKYYVEAYAGSIKSDRAYGNQIAFKVPVPEGFGGNTDGNKIRAVLITQFFE